MGLNFFLQPFTDINKKESSNGNSYHELDGLRGIAVIIVLLSHTSAFGMYGQGSIGVLLFFFLSGFVLQIPFVQHPERMRSKRAFASFFVNRALRIVPIYWIALILIHLYVSNEFSWVLWNASFVKGWNHFWSVAQEVRFYILFPFIILIISFIKLRWLQIFILIGLIITFYKFRELHQIDMMDGRQINFYFWMFLGGVLSCFISESISFKQKLNHKIVSPILSTASILALLFIIISSTHFVNTLWRPLIPEIPRGFSMNGWKMPILWFWLFLLIFLSSISLKNTPLNRFLKSPILRHLGLLSYSMYLFHMNIMFVLQGKGFLKEGLFVSVLICSYIAAYFSYILIEKPFLSLKLKTK